MKIKSIKLTMSKEEYDKLWAKVLKARVARIQNGQPVPCMVKYIKQILGIKYD